MNVSSTFRRNWKAGLSVALTSIPMSLSLAVASKATPLMGIITAVWAGLVAAFFGGSPYNVVGPAGALSGILAVYAMNFGMESLPLLAVMTGCSILLFYVLKWDRYIVFIPSSVVHGFTLGVAFIIGLGQLNFALGLSGLPPHESFLQNLIESLRHVAESDPMTLGLFLGGLVLLFVLAKAAPSVPAAVVVAVVGIGIGYASSIGLIDIKFMTLLDRYGTFHASLFAMPAFKMPALKMSFFNALFTTTIVGILETILSAKIADTMAKAKREFDQRKEIFGLGLANIASGLAGGLPATGVLARTALNVRTGADSSMASGINAVGVAVLSLALFTGFQYLPLAIVASILVYVSIRMIELEHYAKLLRIDPTMLIISIVVAALTVTVDPLIGILTGSTISMLLFLKQLSVGQSEITMHRDKQMIGRIPHSKLSAYDHHGDTTVYRFAGELTYFNAGSHRMNIRRLRGCSTIILSLRNLFYIDLDGLDALRDTIKECEESGKQVLLTGSGESIEPMLKRTRWYHQRVLRGTVYRSTTDALAALGFPLTKAGA